MPYAPDLAGCALDGRYELHELIGEGTFGRVYRGYDRRLARPVAIKVIKPWWAEDPDGAESFEREAQLLARVSDPGIVQIFDVGQAEEGLYFVTELVEGESLAARLKRGGPLAPWEACEVAEQLCRALEHAHAEHIVHRDIKPANVLISDRGRVKVGDLGIARLAEGSTDGGTATIVGTPRYMAPEQASGLPVTPATDVYSAGIVLYEMLAGRPPFGGESAVEIALQHVQMEPPPLPPGTPRSLETVIERALAKDPADRYQSAVAMAEALERASASAGADSSTPHPGSDDWWATPTEVQGEDPTEIVALDTRTLPRGGVDPTRKAPTMSPRRTVNPAARRRAVAVFVLALAVLVALLIAARALTAPPTVAVPRLNRLSEGQAARTLTRAHLRATFTYDYSDATPLTVFAQSPAASAQVKKASKITVSISKGPRPIPVPTLTGTNSGAATETLKHLNLKASVTTVPAPGTKPGIVVRQQPTAGHDLKPRNTVALFVAEVPFWHALTSFNANTGGGQSVPFRIQGSQWRIVYSLSYNGTCDFVFFCNGPSAQVLSFGADQTNESFDLGSGSGKTKVLKTGPGLYQIDVTPGWDDARWSIEVQDWK